MLDMGEQDKSKKNKRMTIDAGNIMFQVLLISIFFDANKNDIINMKIGDIMSEQIINNFYFERAIYIVLIVLFAFYK